MSWHDALEIGFLGFCIAAILAATGIFRSARRDFCCPRCLLPGSIIEHESGATWCRCEACGMEWVVEG